MFPGKGLSDLKGTRYIWLYSSGNLPEKYREKDEELKKSDLLTGKAYSMKENIRDLWTAPSVDDAMKYWNSWYSWVIHSSTETMKDTARMMKIRLKKMMNYLSSQDHRCKGRRDQFKDSANKEHLKTAIYFRCGNLKLYP